jgi:IS30 family transposase
MTYSQLSLDERYFLSSLKARGVSIPQIAKALGRSPSTLYRELRRNERPTQNRYTPFEANSYATARRRRERRGSHYPSECWDSVYLLLQQQWSPEQIVGHFARYDQWPISLQTIYRYIKKDRKRGGSLFRALRIMPKRRRKRYGSDDSRGVLRGKRMISMRPASIESRLEFGHWEGDTVMGKDRHQAILTLVERMTGLTRMAKLSNRTAEITLKALSVIISKEPHLFKTITFDNGTEFHSYKKLEERFPVLCYFANPHHPWERGSKTQFVKVIEFQANIE